jgi:DNA-binding CsgD family transcriptional regulator
MATVAPSLEDARAALGAGEWARALDGFEAAIAVGRTAEALDGSGRALWWLGRTVEAIGRRRDAYAAFRKNRDMERAARIALWLAHEQAVQGNDAVSRGWFARADRICSELGPSSVHGWLALARTERTDDPSEMERLARGALDIAQSHADPDLEIRSLARLGLALVSQAHIDEGVATFDEAMTAATGGDAFELDVLGETYCDMFLAIEIAGDDGGFNQWSNVLVEFLNDTKHAPGLAFCGSCCGELFVSTGKFDVAESELTRALRELTEQGQRARCVHPAAKLAELRVMQGRFEEAERLLEGHEGVPETVRARIALALGRGELAVAAALLERRLNSLGSDSLLSLPYLSQLVEVRVAKGDLEAARSAAARLSLLGQATGHVRVEAEAARAVGRVAVAEGDLTAARPPLERALELFTKMTKRVEAARTRMLLAEALAKTDPEVAVAEARAALASFERCGATHEADAAASLLRALTGEGRAGPKDYGTLSKREQEVLALIAEGLTNAEVASRLFISTKTAGHHVSNILMKLGLRSRAEATAWALRNRGI